MHEAGVASLDLLVRRKSAGDREVKRSLRNALTVVRGPPIMGREGFPEGLEEALFRYSVRFNQHKVPEIFSALLPEN
jgi:hypothetical protein